MDLELADSAVLCTAATSGLGLASATAFAREGADVAVCGRTAGHIDDARETLRAAGNGDVLATEADITDPDHVAAFVEQAAEKFGGIDHVVTSAGGPPSGPFEEMADRDWYQAYDMLVMSVVWTLRETVPYLRESESGTLVAITSRTVREVREGLLLSNAVRRAVDGLVKTVSREMAPDIRANAVLPGAHETARIEELIEAAVERGAVDDYDAGYRDWADDVPLDRIGDPQELGDVVAFLSSPRASFVNGASLAVDGGSMRS
ncbi:SDR family oxidoreductase [Salinibaculum salinum]|uniref:SDR family oxidoreductase n=1 Tax=Salinibaculum salinum TaxID=3131996 RepID=UPI0030EDF79D